MSRVIKEGDERGGRLLLAQLLIPNMEISGKTKDDQTKAENQNQNPPLHLYALQGGGDANKNWKQDE